MNVPNQNQKIDLAQALQNTHHTVLDVLSQANAAFVNHSQVVNSLMQEAQKLVTENTDLKAEIEQLKSKKK